MTTSPTPSNWSIISSSEHLHDLTTWLTDACSVFARFPYEAIITNDSPYDIESLYTDYKAKCKELGIEPPKKLFASIVEKNCKKERPRRSYDDDDYYSRQWGDRTNYNQDIYQ